MLVWHMPAVQHNEEGEISMSGQVAQAALHIKGQDTTDAQKQSGWLSLRQVRRRVFEQDDLRGSFVTTTAHPCLNSEVTQFESI